MTDTTTTNAPAFSIRPAISRGPTNLGWLNSQHSFSFGRYHDPERMGFHGLRVLNDDRVAPGQGFPEHPHADMEILSWVLDGSLAHRDSTGTVATLPPFTAQLMSAGSGVTHSEFNGSATDPVHFLQVWIEPRQRGLAPNYQERPTQPEQRRHTWVALANPEGNDGAAVIQADASVRVADVQHDADVLVNVEPGRVAYVHVVSGQGAIEGRELHAGDAVTAVKAGPLRFAGAGETPMQLMWFDLPA
ncbi:MAG: pirin family protein [Planctomycetota bacterium]